MKKEIIFKEGFDKRDSDPNKNYGIHGLEIRFILKNYKGAVQFLLFTNWFPTGSTDLKWYDTVLPNKNSGGSENPMFVTLLINPFMPSALMKPLPADLGYHSPKPTYEGQGTITESCEFLGGKPCYYDGSGLNAMRIFEVLLNEGDKEVWRELQIYHEHIFGESILKQLRKKIEGAIESYLKFFGAMTGEDEETKRSILGLEPLLEKKKDKE